MTLIILITLILVFRCLVAVADVKTNKVEPIVSGKKGFKELQAALLEQSGQAVWGVIKVHSVDNTGAVTAKRDKFVALCCVGSNVTEMSRGYFNFQKQKVHQYWGSTAVVLDLHGQRLNSTFSERIVAQQLLTAGAAHKPTEYDFGGNCIVKVNTLSNGDDQSDEESDADFD